MNLMRLKLRLYWPLIKSLQTGLLLSTGLAGYMSARCPVFNIPTLLVGGGSAGFKGNRHIQTKPETPFANCLLAVANVFGCELKQFGTLSTGEISL